MACLDCADGIHDAGCSCDCATDHLCACGNPPGIACTCDDSYDRRVGNL